VTAGESTISPARDRLDAALELLGLEAPVHEIAGRAVADRAGDQVLVLGVAEHQHLRALGKRAGGGDAVHHRHADVEADDVGTQLLGLGDRLAAVAGLPHHLEPVGLREQRRDAATHDRVVVDQEDSDHRQV
jgi:hypothetical protein